MALSLTAEQKKILQILKIDEQYIIPAYQRPYSWEYDQCFQLYNDLIEAFNAEEDYFIGNIIIAKSDKDEYELDVIDGQQRLTTLFLMIKVLSLFTSDEIFQEDFTKIIGGINRKTRQYEYRIKTNVFESNDAKNFREILEYDKNMFDKYLLECSNKIGEFQDKKCKNRFQKNILYFYSWFKFYANKDDNNLDNFISYFLEKVYLLPIELSGKTKEEASEKALVIFETINNRGMNLEDADIFKAKLYKRAKKINEEKIFINLWLDFKNSCENLKVDIDDIFRYYSHIVRGEKNITSSEINLREFFTTKDYSPFNLKKYKEVMDDLTKIVDILEFIYQERQKETILSKWLQLIDIYSNQYPKIALVVYLYINDDQDNKENMNVFLESLIRYVYYQGSTTRIKQEIYNIIKKISNGEKISSYYKKNIDKSYFDYLGALKKGYALLAFYSDRKLALSSYYIDKVISAKDINILNWEEDAFYNFIDSLGNFVILDIPKKNISLRKKIEYFKQSSTVDIKSIEYDDLKERDEALKNKLVKFFKENI